MRKVFHLIIFIVFLLSSINAVESWTVMVYLDADNSLEAEGLDDFMEMSKVGSNTNVNIIVQMDRYTGSGGYGDWTDTKRFYITKDMTPDTYNAVMDLGELDMGDKQTLIDFFKWGVDNYPAEHYLLVLWDHGSGWYKNKSITLSTASSQEKAACYDETSGDYLYYTSGEIEAAFNSMYQYIGKKIDITGFDVCLNQMVENANYLYPYTNYLVGSEDTEWGDGWSYWYFLDLLTNNPGMTPHDLASDIVDAYANGDDGNNNSDPAQTGNTQSALDLSNFSTIVSQLHDLAVYGAHYYSNGYKTEMDNAYSNTHLVASYNGGENLDLIAYINKLTSYSLPTDLFNAATNLRNNLNDAMVNNYSFSGNDKGIAIYFPSSSGYNSYYDNNKLAVETYWDSAINSILPVQNFDFSKSISDYSGDGVIDKGESFTFTLNITNSSNFMLNTTTITIYTDNNFSDFNSKTFNLYKIGVDKTYSNTTTITVNPNYNGFGAENIYVKVETPYWNYSKIQVFNITIGEPNILLVDDDGGETAEIPIKTALNDNDACYRVYDINANGDTFPSTLLDNYRVVIWNTGNKQISRLFKSGEIGLIENYLDNHNGNILLSSKYLLRSFESSPNDTNTVFTHNYLHVKDDDKLVFTNTKELEGIFGDPITAGLNMLLADYQYELSIYRTEPEDGAINLFKDQYDTKIGIRFPRYLSNSNFKVIFLPFPLERSNYTSLNTFIKNTIDWFYGLTDELVFDPALVLAYPNPSNGVDIRFTEVETDTEIYIYSINGNLIKNLGTGEHTWDLTNNENKKVKSGVYLYYVTKNGEIVYTGKMAVIR